MGNLSFAVEDLSKTTDQIRAESRNPAMDSSLCDKLKTQLQEIEEPLREALECAERIKSIVGDLKVFSRSDEKKIEAVNVCEVMESCLRMAKNDIRHRAHLTRNYGDVPLVAANEARLGQIFLNLVMNAVHAIPEGQADKNEIQIVTRTDNLGHVIVEVRDTGAGMPESTLAHIFDPFFTTKPIGVGTGLGLSICHRIITEFGGQIRVESEVGKGTVFQVVLSTATTSESHAHHPIVETKNDRQGKILVVDDEIMVGKVVQRILAGEHDVVVVSSAPAALEQISQGQNFDLILCDLMMPGMSGMDLHDKLSSSAPELAKKIVFMTGGAFSFQARKFLDQVETPHITKPFNVANVRKLVQKIVNKSSNDTSLSDNHVDRSGVLSNEKIRSQNKSA